MVYDIALKRLYAEIGETEGARVLVDRLWPRGKRRESMVLTDWYRDASPSIVLRRQYHQQDISHALFATRYRGELRDRPDCLIPLMRHARWGPLTLLTAVRNVDASHLPILRDALLTALQQEDADDSDLASPPCYLSILPRK